MSFSLFELLFEVMHNIVLSTIQVAMQKSIYISISCDKVTTIVYVYVIADWKRIPILLNLQKVVDGTTFDNLMSLIMGALLKLWGLN
jgi:hypothetical protein